MTTTYKRYMAHTFVDVRPSFVENNGALLKFTQPTYFVARVDDYQSIALGPFKLIAKNQIGHVPVVVFKKI